MSKITKQKIIKALTNVPDPELNISIVDLGLIYDVKFTKRKDGKKDVLVIMTLTTMGCPLFSLMEGPIKSEIKKLKGVGNVGVELTFDPAWNPDKMSKEARMQLGFE